MIGTNKRAGLDASQRKNRPTIQRIDFAGLNAAAMPVLSALLLRLLPGGRVVAHEFIALNPRRPDRHAGSFKVRIGGRRQGAWADFATGDRGGDVVSLIAYVENIRQSEAARLLARMLGIEIGGARHA
jgi:hypothetical protein